MIAESPVGVANPGVHSPDVGGNDGSTTPIPPDVDDVVRVGPFVAGGRPFVVESNVAETATLLADRLRDLRVDTVDGAPTVLLVVRHGPAWVSHPWGVWRDGEPCETTLAAEYVTPYVLWEVTRLVLESAHPLVPVHAAAVVRDGRALVLAGQSHAGKSTLAGWLTAHGWDFLTDEVALLERSDDGATLVHPFWRPIGVRRPGPLDDLVTVPEVGPEVLVPASQLGRLGSTAPLVAVVFPQYEAGAAPILRPQAPAGVVRELAGHLPTLGSRGRSVFRAIVDVAATVPAFALDVDDLDAAAVTLGSLVLDGVST